VYSGDAELVPAGGSESPSLGTGVETGGGAPLALAMSAISLAPKIALISFQVPPFSTSHSSKKGAKSTKDACSTSISEVASLAPFGFIPSSSRHRAAIAACAPLTNSVIRNGLGMKGVFWPVNLIRDSRSVATCSLVTVAGIAWLESNSPIPSSSCNAATRVPACVSESEAIFVIEVHGRCFRLAPAKSKANFLFQSPIRFPIVLNTASNLSRLISQLGPQPALHTS
jgi:hypothetical protein